MKNKKMLFYKIETPLHMGSGIDLSVVDMPIAREKHTGFPKLESSGIKGAFRSFFNNKGYEWKDKVNILFGPEDDGSKYSSSLVLYEGKILLFPVKTLRGVFGWITCPMVLNRFKADMAIFKDDIEENTKEDTRNRCNMSDIKDSSVSSENTILSDQSDIIYPYGTFKENVIIEDFTFKINSPEPNQEMKELVHISDILSKNIESQLIERKIKKDIFVVSDDAFNYFVNMSTEISTRVRLENGIVNAGPFTEEYVPAEAVFYGFTEMNNIPKNAITPENVKKEHEDEIGKENLKDKLFNEFINNLNYIQLGGNTTLGKGIVKIIKADL